MWRNSLSFQTTIARFDYEHLYQEAFCEVVLDKNNVYYIQMCQDFILYEWAILILAPIQMSEDIKEIEEGLRMVGTYPLKWRDKDQAKELPQLWLRAKRHLILIKNIELYRSDF